jgi:hypothetical protein
MDLEKKHEYVCNSFDATVRVRTSDREQPGPISCSADVLPFSWTLNVRHHQYVQYRLLRTAIKSQQRFDTMRRQRPGKSAKEDPRAWWQYAVACVTSRPNSRPWSDVQRIVRKRDPYIDLVVKKNAKKSDINGYHAGLTEDESAQLLKLEEFLPIEAMSAFHIVALRRAHLLRSNPELFEEGKSKSRKSWSKGLGRFRFSSSRKRSATPDPSSAALPPPDKPPSTSTLSDATQGDNVLDEKKQNDEKGDSVKLLEAMTRRLGNKVWFVDWRLHDVTLNIVLVSPRDDSPIAHLVLSSRGNVRSFGRGKRDFCFDISQCDILHHDELVLFVRPPEDDMLTEIETDEDLDETLGSLIPKISTFRRGGAHVEGKPDLVASSGFLDLPPDEVVCRVASGQNGTDRNLSISSHPANLNWKSSMLDELLDFFVRRAEEVKADLTEYVRSAATPLARKAQLALLSPGSFAIHLNIAAPKVWLPISGNDASGVLLLDAGVVRVSGSKREGSSVMTWDVKGKAIHASYSKGRVFDVALGFLGPNLNDSFARMETTVIKPFNISMEASNPSDHPDGSSHETSHIRAIDIYVSPVCLNLVDAEVLARSFGKWYVRSIHRANRKASGRSVTGSSTYLPAGKSPKEKIRDPLTGSTTNPLKMTVKLEKLELALEGHSKASVDMDDRSLASLDSAHDGSPPVRIYLVEICDVEILREVQDQLATTSLAVHDASILRLKEGAQYSMLKTRYDAGDAQYQVLVRSRQSGDPNSSLFGDSSTDEANLALPPIIQASIMHDGYSHLDEVEVDIDSVVLRVTPTTLKDCAKAIRRIAEITQLATQEMARKVHEEGRKARRRDRPVGKCSKCMSSTL